MSNFENDSDKKYVSEFKPQWFTPEEETPPKGMLQLLTVYGKCTYGNWVDNGYYCAWAPLVKIPSHIKEKMLEKRASFEMKNNRKKSR